MKIHVCYYAALREARGLNSEMVDTNSKTASELYDELQKKFHFKLRQDQIRPAINNEFCDWSRPLKSDDEIVFIPPVAGG